MGQGEETKTRTKPTIEIQERGEIFFFYRPKVDKEEAHGPQDVQRLYLVLRPESGERAVEEKQDPNSGKEGTSKNSEEDDDGKKTEGGRGSSRVNIEKEPLLRLVVMGRKTLPDPAKRSTPYWGFVEMVTTKIDQLKDALRGVEYDTKSKGHRHLPDSRPLAEGIYRILRHSPSTDNKRGKKLHTHLIYKLEYPPENREHPPAQEAMNISREASFVIQIKNPEIQGGGSGFTGLQSKRKAAFPARLQGLFGHKRFREADPPDFLNFEGCEFLLVSASDDVEEELGLELKAEEGGDDGGEECSDLLKMFGDVGPARPLLEGFWA